MQLRNLPGFLRNLYNRLKKDEITALGAQTTYYLILAFMPFLVFLITLISYTPITREQTMENLAAVIPPRAYELVVGVLQGITASDRPALLSSGMLVSVWMASNGVSSLIRGINKAYDQEETRSFLKVTGISVLFTLALSLVIVFTFTLLVFGELIGRYLFSIWGISAAFKTVWGLLRYIIALSAMTLVFVSLYYFIPNRRLRFREVLPGALLADLGWVIISLAFSFYVNNIFKYSNTYGSLGGVFILLLWLYWCSIIVLLGGELNAALFSRKRSTERYRIDG